MTMYFFTSKFSEIMPPTHDKMIHEDPEKNLNFKIGTKSKYCTTFFEEAKK